MLIRKNDVVLFQGDSITDAKREPGHELGRGYAWMAAAQFGRMYPELGVAFLNRGISGNRVRDLQARWEADCLELKPGVVSIYIGVNDTWRRYDRSDPTSAEAFAAGYRDILDRTVEGLPGVKLMLVEPFLLPVPEDRRHWREDLDPKIHGVRDLAREYGAAYVPLDGLFAQASAKAPCPYWAPDGVHPSPAGHALIADAWLKAAGVTRALF
ncbi:lipase [Paenibacillus chitinolyticus]|uniref:SGNH/GDSL hydrolase family protein n=1 Tax=Paenibacillus chitinolyticus TaxID=79263 RepID=UPI0026E4C46F|nr:SGNH/GDSL hydrolase family protein [Paenibacillus chitinolyticus]GKS13256.1 lipase [Paenibacillus chitinolyticus]